MRSRPNLDQARLLDFIKTMDAADDNNQRFNQLRPKLVSLLEENSHVAITEG